MPRATCRCGQRLSFPADGPDRVICPKCQARIRVKRPDPSAPEPAGEGGDGYIRFTCPCGRRLKVRDTVPRPTSGRCPDCDRVVPVPSSSTAPAPGLGDPEASTAEMDAADLAELARWAESYQKKPRAVPVPASTASAPSPAPAAVAGPQDYPNTESFDQPVAYIPEGPAAPVKVEAGLRVCPRCGRPVHLGAETCRHCGAHVPRR